jgi:integrase
MNNLTNNPQKEYMRTQDKPLSYEGGLFADMKVKIRTQERCPLCGKAYKLEPTGLFCRHKEHRQRPNKYHLEWWFLGEHFRLYGLETFKEAFTKAGSIEQEIEERKFRPEHYRGKNVNINRKFSFSIRFQKWLDFKEKICKPSYIRKVKQYQNEFEAFFGNEDIRMINTDRIMEYYESLIDTVGEKTQYNKLGVIHSFMQDMLDREAIHSMPKFPKIKFQKKEPVWIEEAIQEDLLKVIPLEHQPIFKFLFWTGTRHSEARALHWDDLDFKNDVVTIKHNFSDKILTTTKTEEERKIPMTESLKELFLNLPHTLHCPYVFTIKGKPYYESKLGKIWRKACEDIGLKGIRPYDGTRHSFASQLVNKGKSLEIIGEILGHSDIRTTKKYAHISMDAMREAMKR